MADSAGGTYEYAAPEQMGRRLGSVGPYSDVYGFGKTLCYCLFLKTHLTRSDWRMLDNDDETLSALLSDCIEEDCTERPENFIAVLKALAAPDAKAEQRHQAEEQTAREADQAEQRRQAKEQAAPISLTTDLIADRYQVRGDNGDILYDTTTGLEWQRCSLGQSWDGRTCTGEANRYTWDEACAAADQVPGWRLPTIDELKTLIYCSNGKPEKFGCKCSGDFQRPTIVPEAFPETPSDLFWSGSPHANDSSSAWYVYFGSGNAHYNYRSHAFHVRLVRGGQ